MRQAVVTVATAATISGATLLSAQAADEWHEALRQEIKWSAAVQSDVHRVYLDEAPLAWRMEIADVLARPGAVVHAPGLTGDLARIDAGAHAAVVAQYRATYVGSDTLLGSDRYRMPQGGQDLPRRLADVRRSNGGASLDGPADGDQRFLVASLLAGASIPLVGLHLLLIVVARGRRRRADSHGIEPMVGDSVVVRSRGPAAVARRAAAVVPLLAWAAVTTLPAVQLHQAKLEIRAQQVAAIQSVRTSTAIACSTTRTTFSTEAKQTLLVMSATSLGAQLASLDADDAAAAAAATALSSAHEAVWPRLEQLEQAMSRPPALADGVDRPTAEVVNASPADWERLSAVQRQSADLAHELGQRAGLLSLAIFLAALVGVARRPGAGSWSPTVNLLLMAASATVTAWAFAG
ncbi:hypothetical protein [Lentzea sp. NBRC 105346]|uniref:hypothetical protein n=1 Tax=Lentzea sp. NBRC 105346 TaxID=3032205 RepID=UPI00255216E0|nr:hypothetical protein [Lentzea sp. NBRC 105346]